MGTTAETLTIQKLGDNLNKVQAKFDTASTKLNSILQNVPGFLGWVVDKIESLWNSFLAECAKLWQKVQEMWDNIVWPSELRDAASEWDTKVSDPVSKISGGPDLSRVEVDDHWHGSGATSYKNILFKQRTALQNIVGNFVTPMQNALREVAKAETIFIWAVVAATIVLLGAIVIAIAALCGVITAPAAIQALIGGIVIFIGAYVTAYGNLKSTVDDQKTKLETDVKYDGFDEGKWPKTTVLA